MTPLHRARDCLTASNKIFSVQRPESLETLHSGIIETDATEPVTERNQIRKHFKTVDLRFIAVPNSELSSEQRMEEVSERRRTHVLKLHLVRITLFKSMSKALKTSLDSVIEPFESM